MKLSELRHTEIVAHFKGMIAFTRMTFRDFTSQMEDFTGRSVDNDAPPGLRQEFIDLAFHTFEKDQHFDESRLHKIITQNLGFAASGQPYGGFRYAAGRDITRPKWPRVYDLICRLWAELPTNLQPEYRTGVNRILAGYNVAWDLGEDGQLHRILPPAAQRQVEEAFRELSQNRFAAALASFQEAINAYDDRPQWGRDACKNIFDALESTSKEIFGMRRQLSGTFSQRHAGNSQWRAKLSQFCRRYTIWQTVISATA